MINEGKPFTRETGKQAQAVQKHKGGAKGLCRPPEVLKDMRYVSKTPAPVGSHRKGYNKDQPPDTEQQKMLRAIKQENPQVFLAQLIKFEMDFKQTVYNFKLKRLDRDKEAREEALALNHGRVKDVIESFLADFETKHGPIHSRRVVESDVPSVVPSGPTEA